MALFVRNGLCRSLYPANVSGSLSMMFQDIVYDKWGGPLHSICCPSLKRENKALQLCRTFHSSLENNKKKDEPLSRQLLARAQYLTARLDKKKAPKAQVWRNMTIEDLSKALEKDPRTVLAASRDYVQTSSMYRKKSDIINDTLVIGKLCKLFGKTPDFVKKLDIGAGANKEEDHDVYPRPPADEEVLVKRPPVVTIMGHVDHGKTTLLDSLRSSNVVASEFGGITQHIGAFSVKLNENDSVTFIDTPGHAAFTSMRSRGAHATDIVVLVVAADDGVMEQTVESIRMAKDANVPIIVAINKIDKPSANIKRVEEMLARHGIHTENMHGDVQAIPVSALQGTNLHTLVEAILAQAEIMELKGDPTGFVEGIILESRQDPHRGKLASAIIRRGTLRKGAVLVAGCAHAKIRLMFDESGTQLTEAPPSAPVEMMGWRELPSAGELMLEVESEKQAHQVLKYREGLKQKERDAAVAEEVFKEKMKQKEEHNNKRRMAYEVGRYHLRSPKTKIYEEDATPRIKVIIKGDVDGSVEAILDVLETYSNEDVPLDVVHYGVGNVSLNDIELAETFKAIIYCFNVKTPTKELNVAKQKGVSVRSLNVIYRLIDDLKKEISSKLPMYDTEEILGEADVLQQFEFTERKKKTLIIGLRVKKGDLFVSERARLIRNDQILYDGVIASMRHLKNEVKSLRSGIEGGIVLENSSVNVQLGDNIVCYKIVQKQKEIDWDPGF